MDRRRVALGRIGLYAAPQAPGLSAPGKPLTNHSRACAVAVVGGWGGLGVVSFITDTLD